MAKVGVPSVSLTEACAWSFVRALTIAAISLPIAVCLTGLLRGGEGRPGKRWPLRRSWLLFGLLVPFLMPELLIGFVYAETTLELVGQFSDSTATAIAAPRTQLQLPQTMSRPINSADITAECLYALLLLLRFAPVAALTMWLMPAPRMSAEAIHCHKLLRRNEPARWRRWAISLDCFSRGPLMASLPAFAVVFLLVFQEFEIASLMQVSRYPIAWTVWLFDNHAGGLMLSRSLQLTLAPVLCELLVVGAVFLILLPRDWHLTESLSAPRRYSKLMRLTGTVFVAIGIAMTLVVPLWRLATGITGGIAGLIRQPTILGSFASELCTSLAFGLTAALAAYWLTGLMFGLRRKALLAVLCGIPGLVGSLVISLVALALFQLPAMNPAYDTPLPMLCVLTLFLLPRAILLRLVFSFRQPRASVFIADVLGRADNRTLRENSRGLLWALRKRPAFWVVILLAYWGYWDLTIASILRPTNLEPFTPGLYDLMHYGHNETLAAMTLLAGLFPGLILLTAHLSRRAWRASF